MNASPTTTKPPKHRSPSYPAYDLEATLKRAHQLSKIAGNHPAPISAAIAEWGYTAKSSNGLLTIAALKKFGLAKDEGKGNSRQLCLTPLGKELVFYDADRSSEDWKQRARQAALTPSIHKNLWTKYKGDLPTDAVIKPYLVLDLNFSKGSADEVLRELRSTLAFAQISSAEDGASVSGNEADEDESELVAPAAIPTEEGETKVPEKTETPPANLTKPQAARTVQVPYSPTGWALLQAPFPMTEAAWKQMIAVLEAMKPGLVSDQG
jgi:hypothetical protein